MNFIIMLVITIALTIVTALLTPTQKAKAGTLDDFDFPQIEDGSPIFYIAGKVRMNGPNLVWYGALGTKAIKKAAGLFKKSTVGYKYYLGFQLAICLGPNVKLHKIWFGNDDPIIDYGLDGVDEIHTPLTDLEAFGGDAGGGGYDLVFSFYTGASDQIVDPYLQEQVPLSVPPDQAADAIVPAWRGLAHAVIAGYIGNSPSLQNMSFEISRVPDPLGLGDRAKVGTEGDVNPANVLYELMTNNFGALSYSPASMYIADFVAAGITLYNEDNGISISAGGNPGQARDTFQDILKQIDGTMYEDPLDGKVHLILMRQDYEVDDLVVFDETNISQVASYSINMWSDTKNKVRVKYSDRSRNYEDRVAVAEDMANVKFQDDQVKAVNVDYKYVFRADQANKAAVQQLQVYATPIANVRFTTLRVDLTIRPGRVIVFAWPEYGIAQLILRVLSVDLGDLTNNRVIIEGTIDEYAGSDIIFAPPVPYQFVKPSAAGVSIIHARTFEAPRWYVTRQIDIVDVDAPRVMAPAVAANGAQLSYDLWMRTSAETDYTQYDTEIAYTISGTVVTAYPASYGYDTTTGIVLDNLVQAEDIVETDAAGIASGVNLVLIDDEIIGFETYNTVTKTLKGIHRGLLDTVPAAHSAGARAYWLTAEQVGSREFASGDTVLASLAAIALTGSQDASTGRHLTVPGAA